MATRSGAMRVNAVRASEGREKKPSVIQAVWPSSNSSVATPAKRTWIGAPGGAGGISA